MDLQGTVQIALQQRISLLYDAIIIRVIRGIAKKLESGGTLH